MKKLELLWIAFVLSIVLSGCQSNHTDAKPVIYLYPEEEANVTVKLDYQGQLTCTYPEYENGWNVTAYPDGTLVNHQDDLSYSYLFWEGTSDIEYDLSQGFVVKGEDTADFLRETLEFQGLTPKEYNEFIVYWLPQLESNPYNLISFQQDTYTQYAPLTITPKPDHILRIFMVCKPLEHPIEIQEQELSPFERDGFTVVEWGGTLLK
ncbi:MAG: hypothetical protein ACOX60_07725 [Massiliimalia sp.]